MITQRLTDKLDALFEARENFRDYEGLPVSFYKNGPASGADISLLVSNGELKLPADYLDFLQAFDGCTLFQYQDLGGFEFLGTGDIVKENHIQRQIYEGDWDHNLTSFCVVLGDGDFISFRTYSDNSYEILDCYHDDSPQNWKVIGHSFIDFVEKLIDGKGKRFWL